MRQGQFSTIMAIYFISNNKYALGTNWMLVLCKGQEILGINTELERKLSFIWSNFLILQWETVSKGRCFLCSGSYNFFLVKLL